MSYFVCLLLAIIVTILPAAMWADMALPMKDNWENWYWKGQPYPRPRFTLQNPPRLFRAEMLAYKSLVTPPAYLRRAITGWPTAYGAPFVPPYGETSGIPPLALALDHCVWALPFWFCALIVLYEVIRRGCLVRLRAMARAA